MANIMTSVEYTKGTRLTHLELYGDAINGYFLCAKYRMEDETSIRELEFPKIGFPLSYASVAMQQLSSYRLPEVNIGFGWCNLHAIGKNPVYFTETVIEEKVHEMTMDELEKKLGYKVKIVNKKE